MALEKGGRADKLGNRYEGHWVAEKTLDVLEGKARSILIEALGDDERGTEFWLEMYDGRRQAHQCKVRNASKESWTISELGSNGVLHNLKFQLDRSENHEFVFVSGVPATKLSDICDSARNSDGNFENFYKHQILLAGMPRTEVFEDFCKVLSLNKDNPADRLLAFNYLRRTRFNLYPFDDSSVSMRIGYTLAGDPTSVRKLLADYAEDNDKFGKVIYQDMLFKYLIEKDILPKNLAKNEQIWPRISELINEFTESLNPLLIRNRLLERTESEKCLSLLEEKGLVILHGNAGFGKSGILLELTKKLREKDYPIIPLRVDKRIPQHTSEKYGNDLGLPDSPVFCLAAIAGSRSSVMIIDQLDSIRWTSSHSSNALEVCKQMVTEILLLRRQGIDIKIILSCRSFDLSHDPEIKHWLDKKDESGKELWGRVNVSNIEPIVVRNIVGSFYDTLAEKQKDILANLQNLYMWCELADAGKPQHFTTTLELLREFWGYKYQRIESSGVSNSEINEVLEKLIEYMKKNEQNSAPARILDKLSRQAIHALRSQSVIQEDASRISFCHQIYLDYLIASNAVEEIENGKNILNWLGFMEQQTLFRRDQLKQALSMLLQDNPELSIGIIKALLDSSAVRFHIKHLALEVLSSMTHLRQTIEALLLELIHDDNWREYIIDIGFNQPLFVKMLIDRGVIKQWLASSSKQQNDALVLLRSTVEYIPDDVAVMFEPYLEKGEEWHQRISHAISFHIAADSEKLFALRMRLCDYNVFPYIINWQSFCTIYPLRVIELFNKLLNVYDPKDSDNTRVENFHEHDLSALLKMTESFPELVWDNLIQFIRDYNDFAQYNEKRWEREDLQEFDILGVIVTLVTHAGQYMATKTPETFIQKTNEIRQDMSLIVNFLLLKAFALIRPDFADAGVEWLLSDFSLLETEERLEELRYKNVGNLIECLTPFCSNELFEQLEKRIISYHEPDELRKALYSFEARKEGYYYHYWGLAQYVLLSKMEQTRLSASSVELLKCLGRRYKNRPANELIEEFSPQVFSIGSKLDKNRNKISDLSWIKIVGNKNFPVDRRSRLRIQEGDHWLETSVSQFSKTLAVEAKSNPDKFGKLALQFPSDIHQSYIGSILESFQLIEPDPKIPEEIRDTWVPASFCTILSFLERFNVTDGNNLAKRFCWLIVNRRREVWPQYIIEKLAYIAIHQSDLEVGQLNVYKSDWDRDMRSVSVNDLYTNTLNCIKGVAARAISSILWHHKEMFEIVRPAIELLVVDPHPVIRMASVTALVPALNINERWALDWFIKVPQDDFRTICSKDAIQFISYTVKSNVQDIGALLDSMMRSDNAETVTHSAKLITSCFIFHDLYADLLKVCCEGSVYLRQGVASTAAKYVGDPHYSLKCRQLLLIFLEDENAHLLSEEISAMFRHKVFDIAQNQPLIIKYLLSKAFSEKSLFLYKLKDYEGDLLQYSEVIFSIFDAFALNKENFKSRFEYRLDEAISFLLRLYDRAKDIHPEVFNKCLDTWDMLYQKRLVNPSRIANIF